MWDGIEHIKDTSWDGQIVVEHEDDPDVDEVGEGDFSRGDDAGFRVVIVVLGEGTDGVQELWCLGLVENSNTAPNLYAISIWLCSKFRDNSLHHGPDGMP
jgi:hypothetical protein